MALPPILKRFLIPWRTYIVILVPLALLPLALSPEAAMRCAFVVLVMIIFWIFEALPLPITSLLPVVLFPLLGVMTTAETCTPYLKDTNILFIGSLMAAIAVEHSNLHYRIALKVILVIGTTPMRIMVGLMVTTGFLSMWIVNSAATALMAPIVGAMVKQLKESRQMSMGVAKKEGEEEEKPDQEAIGYYIAIAYGSSIGGTGTLIGTGTNLSLKGIYEEQFHKDDINFLSWLMFGIPYMLITNTLMTFYLMLFYMSLFRKKTPEQIANVQNAPIIRDLVREKYEALGSLTFHELMVVIWFTALVLLWVFRKPEFIPGWGDLFYSTAIKDATPVMLIMLILFALPSNLDFLRRDKPYEKPTPSVITWKVVQDSMSWSLMLLLGGSFAMAKGMSVSTLSTQLGMMLSALQVLPTYVVMMITCCLVCLITQFSSNVAAANVALPVLAEMSREINLHPMYLMYPATIAASLAYMLPVSTPPNAIILTAGNVAQLDLIKAGFGAAVLSLGTLFILFPTVGKMMYGLGEFPEGY